MVDGREVPDVLAGVVHTASISAHKEIVANGITRRVMLEDCSSGLDMSAARV